MHVLFAVFGVWVACAGSALGAEWTVHPHQSMDGPVDGTLIDGSLFGPFDGVADGADWTFDQVGLEGAVTLAHQPPPEFETRLVFEYNLNPVSAAPQPVTATLSFSMRGAARFPAEVADVQIVSYAADLAQSLNDFSLASLSVVASRPMAPFQPTTDYVVNVNDEVNDALANGSKKIGFRFQIDPLSGAITSQAFLDARDSDQETKPFLTIRDRVPSDLDADRDIDLTDHGLLVDCLKGPKVRPSAACSAADSDLDRDVDLGDIHAFLSDLSKYGNSTP